VAEQTRDPTHWLHRFTADEWLRAAEKELQHARVALEAKQQRAGVVQARRAAGMAWNAVLSTAADEAYGRSYMEHLQALSKDATAPESIRAAARALLEAPMTAQLIMLGKGDARLADSARAILEHARERVKPTASA